MLKFPPAAAAALTLVAAPLAAHAAQAVHVDLRGLHLAVDSDFQKAERRVEAAADAYCGRPDIPLPLELAIRAEHCQAGFLAEGKAAVRDARAKQIAGRSALH